MKVGADAHIRPLRDDQGIVPYSSSGYQIILSFRACAAGVGISTETEMDFEIATACSASLAMTLVIR